MYIPFIVAEKTVYHFSKGDFVMPDRVRFYPYKVTYVDLQDYMAVPNGQPLPVFTDIVKAENAERAKAVTRTSKSATIAFIAAGRYPERLGTSVRGVQVTTLNDRQLLAVEQELRSAKLPHAINPKAFVASKPHSTLYRLPIALQPRPTVAPAPPSPPVGAPRTVVKSTPIQLATDNPLDIGGFTVGFRKPGETPAPTPTVARPTPQPDIYVNYMKAATVNADVDRWPEQRIGSSPKTSQKGNYQPDIKVTRTSEEPVKVMAAASATPPVTPSKEEYAKARSVFFAPLSDKPSTLPWWKTAFYFVLGLGSR